MKKTALVLAAHGSRHESAVNAQVRAWAAQAAQRSGFDEVAVAFHHGSPTFSEVLDGLSADEITVVPVMTSAGYYSDTVLPRELARNRRFPEITLRQTVPVGLHPDISRLIAERANVVLSSHDFNQVSRRDVALAIVGHGTPRHPASRNSTLALVKELRAAHAFGEAIALFLDDEPAVDQWLTLTTKPVVVFAPFLVAAGPHATLDIPTRIGMQVHGAGSPPFMENIAGRRVLCDAPFGSHPGMIDLIVDLASPRTTQYSRISRAKQIEVA